MTALLLAILGSSIIFVIFKLFPKYQIDTFQAIVFNYFTAFVCGIFITNKPWESIPENISSWGGYAFICSVLFISLFLMMGKSSQLNGVARTSVAVKMSMAVTVLAMILYYSESFGFLKILGILAAILGVLLVSKTDNSEKSSASWMLLVLFIGSGLLDFILNIVQSIQFEYFNSSMFTAFGFLAAGMIGLSILTVQLFRKKAVFSFRNVIAGILLGIPNYFSIYMLIESYSQLEWQDSTIVSLINICVVVLSSIVGYIFFKEKPTWVKLSGLACSLVAIILLLVSN